jgi:hypothetical protein
VANVAAAFGGRPVRHLNGAPYSGAVRLYYTTGATALYIGDPVIVLGGGNTTIYQGSPVGSLPVVVLATAGNGNAITGFVQSFFPEQATSAVYNASGTSRGVFVADDPALIYEIMDNGTAALTQAALSASFNLDLSVYSGSTITGRSGATMGTTANNSAGDQLKCIGLAERPNNIVGKNAIWEVMIANHTMVAASPAGV